MKPTTIQVTEQEAVVQTEGNPLFSHIASRRRVELQQFMFYLPNPDPVLRANGQQYSVYNELTYDAHVRSCIASFKDGVKLLEWKIEDNGAPAHVSALFKQVFTFLDNTDERGGIGRMIGEILDARLFGFQPMEVLWRQQGNYILPYDLIGKPQDWFEFDTDNSLRLRTLDSTVPYLLPDYKVICPTYEGSYANPWGNPVLSSCFWPVAFKKGGMKFFVKFAEKYGMPWLLGEHGFSEQKQVDDFRDALEEMVQDAIGVVPAGTKVTALNNTQATSSQIFDRLIAVCKAEIAQAILSHTGSSESTPGKLGGEDGAMQVRDSVINSGKSLVEQVFNVLIRWTCELNGYVGPRPKFTLYEEEEVDERIATRDEKLAHLGWRPNKQYFIDVYKMQPDHFDVADIDNKSTTSAGQAAQFASEVRDGQDDINDLMTEFADNVQGLINEDVDSIVAVIKKNGSNYAAMIKTLEQTTFTEPFSPLHLKVAQMLYTAHLIGARNA